MKLSLIIAAYNSADTIQRTIDSFIEQEYSNKECVVVDGNSKDNTVALLKTYGDKIKWISEPDKGIYDALNKAVLLATGDALCVIGTDDFLPHTKTLTMVANAFAKHKTGCYLW